MTIYFTDLNDGTRMQVGKWYLCSDSGGTWSEHGYDTPAEAKVAWLVIRQHEPFWRNFEMHTPTYLGPDKYWDEKEGAGEGCMCLRAEDLLDFWRAEGYTDVELELSSTP